MLGQMIAFALYKYKTSVPLKDVQIEVVEVAQN